jgi:SAM-dependent methyltransferase
MSGGGSPDGARWDQRYAGEEYAYGTEPNEFLVEQADKLPRGPVLAICEGEGRNAVFLAERGHRVVAVDASGVGLAKARRLAEDRGVQLETVIGDLRDLDLGRDVYSACVSVFCHLQESDRAALHGRLVTALKPGGVLILEAYTPLQLEYRTGGPPATERLVTLEALKGELSGLEFELARELERPVHEGRLHHGPGHVVQLVARKPSD